MIDGNSQVSVVNYGGLDAAYAAWNVSQYENVIAISAAQSADAIGRSAKDAFLRAALKSAHQNGSRFTLISAFLPYDAAAWQDADAILLTWWGSTMRGFPAEGASWSANLPAGLLACFGECPAEGVAPVHIPTLDDRYMPALPATGATTAQTAVPEIETGIVGIQKYLRFDPAGDGL